MFASRKRKEMDNRNYLLGQISSVSFGTLSSLLLQESHHSFHFINKEAKIMRPKISYPRIQNHLFPTVSKCRRPNNLQ